MANHIDTRSTGTSSGARLHARTDAIPSRRCTQPSQPAIPSSRPKQLSQAGAAAAQNSHPKPPFRDSHPRQPFHTDVQTAVHNSHPKQVLQLSPQSTSVAPRPAPALPQHRPRPPSQIIKNMMITHAADDTCHHSATVLRRESVPSAYARPRRSHPTPPQPQAGRCHRRPGTCPAGRACSQVCRPLPARAFQTPLRRRPTLPAPPVLRPDPSTIAVPPPARTHTTQHQRRLRRPRRS